MEKATERTREGVSVRGSGWERVERERERCRQCMSEKCNEFPNTIYRNVFLGQYAERKGERKKERQIEREREIVKGAWAGEFKCA